MPAQRCVGSLIAAYLMKSPTRTLTLGLACFLLLAGPNLAPLLLAEAAPRRPAIIIQGTEGRDAEFLRAALQEREQVHYLVREWVPTAEYPKYSLVAFVGELDKEAAEQTQFSKDDLDRLDRWLRQGGTLLLLYGGRRVFGGRDGKHYFQRLIGAKAEPDTETGGVTAVLTPEHPWVAHLLPEEPEPERNEEEIDEAEELMEGEEDEEDEGEQEFVPGEEVKEVLSAGSISAPTVLYEEHPWLGRGSFDWIRPTHGERIIGIPSGKTALYRLRVDKGQLIHLGWDLSRSINPITDVNPELDTQCDILRGIAASLPVYSRSDYLQDRAAIMGNDPFIWYRDRGLTKAHDPESWYPRRGLIAEPGPTSASEEVKQLRLDAAIDEHESCSFHISSFVKPRALKLRLSDLKTEEGKVLPAECVRLRVQHRFTAGRLTEALAGTGYLRGYGLIESLPEATAVAQWLLDRNANRLSEPLWLFDLDQVASSSGDGESLVINRDEHLSVWLTYQPVKPIPPGLYRGELRIDADGSPFAALPVRIKIWSTRRPPSDTLSLAIETDSVISNLPGSGVGEDVAEIAERDDGRWQRHLRCLIEHNCNVMSIGQELVAHARVRGTEKPLLDALAEGELNLAGDQLPPVDFSACDRFLKPLVELGVRAVMSRGNPAADSEALLAAIARGTDGTAASASSQHYGKLSRWLMSGWVAYLRSLGLRGHLVSLLDGVDGTWPPVRETYERLAKGLAAAGFKTGGPSQSHSALAGEPVERLKPNTRLWFLTRGSGLAFRNATEGLKSLDPVQDEIWPIVDGWYGFVPEEAFPGVWTTCFPLAAYGGPVGVRFGGYRNANEISMAVELRNELVLCSAMEGLRDSIDSLRYHRYLVREVLPRLPAEQAKELRAGLDRIVGEGEGAIIRFHRGGARPAGTSDGPPDTPTLRTEATIKDYKRAHAQLLQLMQMHAPAVE